MKYKDFSFLTNLKDYLNYEITSIRVIRKNPLFILNDVSIDILDSMLKNYNYDYLKINLEYSPYEKGYLLTIHLHEKEGE